MTSHVEFRYGRSLVAILHDAIAALLLWGMMLARPHVHDADADAIDWEDGEGY